MARKRGPQDEVCARTRVRKENRTEHRGAGTHQQQAAGARAPARRSEATDEESDSSTKEGDSEEEEDGGGLPNTTTTARCVWTLKGSLAGRLATDKARKNKEYNVDAPQAAVDAGEDAELAWLTAFSTTFKPAVVTEAADDRRISGLTVPKRRRVSAKPERNKAGRAGLDESAEAFLSTTTYSWVRSEFFLPADHLAARVRENLKENDFDCTDAEMDAWWEEKGHSLALIKAKCARHSIVDSVKSAVWLAHGARELFAEVLVCVDAYPPVAVGTKDPPTEEVLIGGKKRKRYDVSQAAGASAMALLSTWNTTTGDIVAPWRQTGGGGGSEYGKPKWLAALKTGYKTADEPPHFKLWQLALADHVVRPADCATAACFAI